jgi:hypothetical protein
MQIQILAAAVLAAALPAQRSQPQSGAKVFGFLTSAYDKDKDGKITKAEYPRGEERFANLDRDGDGVLTRQDFTAATPGQRAQPRRSPLPHARAGHLPRIGDVAPDFELPMLGMKDTKVKLSGFAGDRPVVLIFGSYT